SETGLDGPVRKANNPELRRLVLLAPHDNRFHLPAGELTAASVVTSRVLHLYEHKSPAVQQPLKQHPMRLQPGAGESQVMKFIQDAIADPAPLDLSRDDGQIGPALGRQTRTRNSLQVSQLVEAVDPPQVLLQIARKIRQHDRSGVPQSRKV